MAIGTATALLAATAIAGGTQVAGTAIAAKGAKAAAKTQAQAANDAQRKVDTAMAPYLQTGQQAMTTLGGLMGLGGGGTSQPQGGAGLMSLPSVPRSAPQMGGAGAAPPGYAGNNPYASAGTYPNYAPQRDPQAAAMARNQSGYGGAGGGRMVQMKAPTGEVSLVPESQVQHFVSRGAQVVGG